MWAEYMIKSMESQNRTRGFIYRTWDQCNERGWLRDDEKNQLGQQESGKLTLSITKKLKSAQSKAELIEVLREIAESTLGKEKDRQQVEQSFPRYQKQGNPTLWSWDIATVEL